MSNLFEYLVDPGRGRRAAAGARLPAATGEAGIRFDNVGFQYPAAPATNGNGEPSREKWALRGRELLRAARAVGGARRAERRRQDHAHQAADAAVRPDGGARAPRRGRLRDWEPETLRERVASSSRTSTSISSTCATTSAWASLPHLTEERAHRRGRRRAAAPTRW